MFDTAAAGYFHADNCYTFNIVFGKYRCQLVSIVAVIEFWTPYECNMAAYKLIVKAAVSICCAVCRDQQPGIVFILFIYRSYFDL